MVKKLCIWFYLLYGTPDTKRLCFNLKMDDCHEQGVTLTCTGMIAITDENGINRSSQTPSDLQIRISPFSWICWIWMPEKYGDSCRFFWTNCARIPPLFLLRLNETLCSFTNPADHHESQLPAGQPAEHWLIWQHLATRHFKQKHLIHDCHADHQRQYHDTFHSDHHEQ